MTEEQLEKAISIKQQIARSNQIIEILDKKDCTFKDMENLGNSLYEFYIYSKNPIIKGSIYRLFTNFAQQYKREFESI